MTATPCGPFIVIGENIHATRVLMRTGPRVATLSDGRPALPFNDEHGADLLLPVSDGTVDGTGDKQRIKHVKAAVVAGLAGGEEAELGLGYVRFLARRQAESGAEYLDLNVDEVYNDLEGRVAAIRWLVAAVEDATPAKLALDSSSREVIRAGLEAASRTAGAPLLNSASLERLDVLDLAAGEGCPVVLSASVEGRMPVSAKERVASGQRIIEVATGRGLTLSALYVDALVLPVAVDADVGLQFLDAVRSLRSTYGRDVHLTGGLSNVSFGLPNRRLINDVFIDLAVGAGADSGIMDPVVNDPRRVFHLDRDTRAYELAADLITGRDPYALGFLAAYRAGELL